MSTRLALLCAVLLAFAIPADAALFRAYLASSGSDTNPCTLVAPCRLLPTALTAVADGGEIWLLDSANYNTATVEIAKSVTILAIPGEVGSVLAIGGPAINVNGAGIKVALRNLVIVPLAGNFPTHGVNMTNGAWLSIEGSVFANLPDSGVRIATAANLRIVDSVFRGNATGVTLAAGASGDIASTKILQSSAFGVYLTGAVGALGTSVRISDSVVAGCGASGVAVDNLVANARARASIARTTISNCTNGVEAGSSAADSNTKVDISDSTMADMGSLGVLAQATAATGSVVVVINRSSAVRSIYGVAAGGGATITIGASTVSANEIGLFSLGTGAIESLGNNLVRGNGTPTSGTIVTVTPI